MSRTAKEMHRPCIMAWMIIEQRSDVRLPKPSLLGRKRGQIDQIPGVHIRRFGGGSAENASKAPLETAPFPAEELPPLCRSPTPEIASPIQEISQETQAPGRRPTDAPIARVWRRAIEQRQQRNFITLRRDLPGHFESDVSAETITSEIIGAVRLRASQISNVLGSQLLDAFELVTTV